MPDLISTQDLTLSAEYFNSADAFFCQFAQLYEGTKSQILKLESKQEYNETGDMSFDKFMTHGIEEAIKMFPTSKKLDIALYKKLKNRNIDFIRCRWISLPMSKYLDWEIECYKFNARHGERIYIADYKDVCDISDKLIQNDFMVFDNLTAMIHNYDPSGNIIGGWKVTSESMIDNCICLFSLIKARAVHIRTYLNDSVLKP